MEFTSVVIIDNNSKLSLLLCVVKPIDTKLKSIPDELNLSYLNYIRPSRLYGSKYNKLYQFIIN
jgi:hypothetical protein